MANASKWFIVSVSVLGLVVFGLAVAIIVLLVSAFTPNPKTEMALPGDAQFPIAYPIIERSINGPDARVQCYNMVQQTGNVQSYSNKLRTCASDTDCSTCNVDPNVRVTCQTPSAEVLDQQTKVFNNTGSKFCLPVTEQCITDSCDFRQCMLDSDCDLCSDDVGSERRMACVFGEATVGKCTVKAEKATGVCLPEPSYCNTKHGTPTWVDDGVSQRWECKCTNPNIHSGQSCDDLTACNNARVTGDTKQYQRLYMNVGQGVGNAPVPWDESSGIPPNVMRCVEDPGKSCTVDADCGQDDVCAISTICQCDGVDAVTGSTFKDDPNDLQTCAIDTCYTNLNGGRWDHDTGGCVCSGRGRSLWDRDTGGKFVYKGTCEERRKGNVMFPGSADCLDNRIASNADPRKTHLVPVLDADTARCILDPCTAISGDPAYPETLSSEQGNWNPAIKKCDCYTDPGGFYDMDINAHNAQNPTTPFATNPLGHMCYLAETKTAQLACQTTGGNTVVADPLAPLGYKCNCIGDYKASADGEACSACMRKDGYSKSSCSSIPCCTGSCWRCSMIHNPEDIWFACSNQSQFAVSSCSLIG